MYFAFEGPSGCVASEAYLQFLFVILLSPASKLYVEFDALLAVS